MAVGARVLRVAVLASHEGGTLGALVEGAAVAGAGYEVVAVISNNRESGALRRAAAAGIEWAHLSGRTHPDPRELDAAICARLVACAVDLVVLAGYLKKLGERTLSRFEGRVVNLHPALLPRHGGPGMFGLAVHEAVLAAGDAVTGASVHLVDGDYDSGLVLACREVPVLPGDTAEVLAARVRPVEQALVVDLVRAVAAAGSGQGAGLRWSAAVVE